MNDANLIAMVLRNLGLNLNDKSLQETPRRIVEVWKEFSLPKEFEFTTFGAEGCNQMLVQSDIPVMSLCEHHGMPFWGHAIVGYLPKNKLAGLSKLARSVDFFARRFQTQERITQQVADFLALKLETEDVGVIVKAEHSCMSVRGAKAIGAKTTTCVLLGAFKTDPQTRAEFMAHFNKD